EHFFPKLRSAGYIRLFYERKPSMELNETNQAIELYNQRSYADVLTRLENVKPTAVSEGMRGACYMMLGQYDKAEATLKNAITLGSRDAVTQLEHLQKLLLVKNSK
ncbi:MAG: tetratricopeptide repeat protein, partial [Mucinivorans sp.]